MAHDPTRPDADRGDWAKPTLYAVALTVGLGFAASAVQNFLAGHFRVAGRELPVVLAGVLSYAANARGHRALARWIIVLSLLAGATLLVSTADFGLFDSSTLLFCATIVTSALLLSTRAHTVVADRYYG